MFHNAFPTSENSVRRKISIEIGYKLCDCSLETSFHVFFDCPVAKKVWKKAGMWKFVKPARNCDV